jgi:hypothetical protein
MGMQFVASTQGNMFRRYPLHISTEADKCCCFIPPSFKYFMKRKFNSDGYQFHQYQQNKQSPLTLTELTEHNKTTTYDVGNPGKLHTLFRNLQNVSLRKWFVAHSKHVPNMLHSA